MPEPPWAKDREGWRGAYDYSRCRPVRSAIKTSLGGIHLETQDFDGYIRTQPFVIATRRFDAASIFATVDNIFFGRAPESEEVYTAKEKVFEYLREVLEKDKPSPKAIRSIVFKELGKEWMDKYFVEKSMGDLGESISSAKWKRMACWLTPETEGPPVHYSNHRSCWWGMQGQQEHGRRKCFSRCRFKSAGGFFLLGKFIGEDEDEKKVPIAITDSTDLRLSIIAMDRSGHPIDHRQADCPLPWAVFNEYDRLSTSGWETDRSVRRNRWLAQSLSEELGLQWADASTNAETGGRDGARALEFETNSGHAPVLYQKGHYTPRLRPIAAKLWCTCRRDYIALKGTRDECRAEGVEMHTSNPNIRTEEQHHEDEHDEDHEDEHDEDGDED